MRAARMRPDEGVSLRKLAIFSRVRGSSPSVSPTRASFATRGAARATRPVAPPSFSVSRESPSPSGSRGIVDRAEEARGVRVAIVSDIHGNRTALEAVVRDLATTSPDLVLHGGDLADGGSSPAEVVARIRSLGWQGVLGNTDEMLARPEAFSDFQRGSSAPRVLFALVEEMATWSRARLG